MPAHSLCESLQPSQQNPSSPPALFCSAPAVATTQKAAEGDVCAPATPTLHPSSRRQSGDGLQGGSDAAVGEAGPSAAGSSCRALVPGGGGGEPAAYQQMVKAIRKVEERGAAGSRNSDGRIVAAANGRVKAMHLGMVADACAFAGCHGEVVEAFAKTWAELSDGSDWQQWLGNASDAAHWLSALREPAHQMRREALYTLLMEAAQAAVAAAEL